MKRRILSLVLIICMAVGCLPIAVSAETTNGTCGENLTWTLDDNGTLTISGIGEMKNFDGSANSPFRRNKSIKSIVIEDGVTSIGDYAFNGCYGIMRISIPKSLKSIGYSAFGNCIYLEAVYIEDLEAYLSIKFDSLYSNPKYYAAQLYLNGEEIRGDIVIPEGITNIPDNMFAGCDGITSVTIPESVTSIGKNAFVECGSMTSINVSSNNKNYSSSDGNLFNKDKTELIQYAIGKSDVSYTVPDSVTNIGDDAFYYAESLEYVTIPDSVTSIGICVFDRTAYFRSEDNWKNGVLYIGNHLICVDSDKISGEYTIKEGIKTIAGGAFDSCEYLTDVKIPQSVISIGKNAFTNCVNLESISIPNSVTSISECTFQACDNLTSVTIPSSVTSIDDWAFAYCRGLKSISIPDSVTRIGDYAFSDCTGLTSIAIPKSVTSVGDGMFENCESLTRITIPKSVTGIGASAFFGCTNLAKVYYTGTEAQWRAIVLGPDNKALLNALVILSVDQTDESSGKCVKITAEYDNNTLINIATDDISVSDITKGTSDENTKVFYWYSFNSMKPVKQEGE